MRESEVYIYVGVSNDKNEKMKKIRIILVLLIIIWLILIFLLLWSKYDDNGTWREFISVLFWWILIHKTFFSNKFCIYMNISEWEEQG
jgi:hypothetical protein